MIPHREAHLVHMKSSGVTLLNRGEFTRFELNGELLITAFSGTPASLKSLAAVLIRISPSEMSTEKIQSVVQELTQPFGSLRNTLELKAVGPSHAMRILEAVLKSETLKLQSSLVREDHGISGYFFGESGKLRISVAERASAPAITKVLIVDDSPTIRKLLTNIFAQDSTIRVVATAEKPSEVEALIVQHRPHVITLDIHMPEMDGVTLLKQIHPKFKIPTVMISSTSIEEGRIVLDALESGAVDYVQKPSLQDIPVIGPIIIEKVKAAAQSQVPVRSRAPVPIMGSPSSHSARSPLHSPLTLSQEVSLIAIGSSTGGTEALKEVLTRLPAQIPPIAIVQHIPPIFSRALAERLNGLCPFEVLEAVDGTEIQANRVLIAPGGTQMKVAQVGGKLQVRITDDGPVNRHKPSVDYLFDSVVDIIGPSALGVILTGMGADGANGLVKMKQKGSFTIAQDESSCVVFGMPKEAIARGGATEVLPLDQIGPRIAHAFTQKRRAA